MRYTNQSHALSARFTVCEFAFFARDNELQSLHYIFPCRRKEAFHNMNCQAPDYMNSVSMSHPTIPSAPIVIIEDDETTLEIISAILRDHGLEYVPFTTGLDAIGYLRRGGTVGALVIDICLPDMDGIDLLRHVRKANKALPCFILTVRDEANSAVLAMKAGANDYFTKPVDPGLLVGSLKAAVRACPGPVIGSDHPDSQQDRWKSSGMKEAVDGALRAAGSSLPVAIRGPVSTGKYSIARLIHTHWSSANKSFRMIDLTSLSEAAAESELFGSPISLLSGQPGTIRGRLEKCRGSTLYLANIEALGPRAQAVLADWLRLESGRPAETPRTKLICSTTADIEDRILNGMFRQDLWYLLAVHKIQVPPLVNRVADIPLICGEILTDICVKAGLRRPSLSRGAMELIQGHTWPHNLMELRNVLEHAVATTKDGLITPLDLPSLKISRSADIPLGKSDILGNFSIEEVTKASLVAALQACGGNRRRAAERLKVSLRTVYYMIQRFGIR